MKKLTAVLGALAIAAVAQANVWNLDWMIGYAYSPDDGTTMDVLSDYSVTWSLVYADSGNLIHSIQSENGMLEFDDEANGGGYGLYSAELFPDEGTFNYLGSTSDPEGNVSLKMRIDLVGENGSYFWESAPTDVKVQANADLPATAYWDSVIIGTKDSTDTDVNATWSPATSVPEPATMSLLGLGALAMVLRRKVRK